MAQPSVASSSPANNAADVFVNIPLQVTFTSPGLESSSINVNSCMLVNVATQATVAIDISYDTASKVLTITPLSTLAEQTVYKIRFPGLDIAIGSNYVLKESGSSEALASTIDITFTTGTRVFIDDSIINKEIADLTLEGEISLPTHVKALGPFAIETSVPKNHTADVPLSLDGSNRIGIKFNKTLSGSILQQDWLTVTAYPILDMEQYLASGNTFGVGSIPTMTGLTYSGQYLYANFSTPMPNNVGISIKVSESITASDGSELGPNEYIFSITTDRYPKIGGIHILKTELLAASDQLNDEYLAALLLKNTIRLMSRWSGLNLSSPQWLAYKYVVNKTILDILDDKDLEKALIAGTRQTLGDFTVSVESIIGQLALKYKRAEKEAEEADDGMQGIKKLGTRIDQYLDVAYRPERLWYGVNGNITDNRFRYYQADEPIANTSIVRSAKVPNWFF